MANGELPISAGPGAYVPNPLLGIQAFAEGAKASQYTSTSVQSILQGVVEGQKYNLAERELDLKDAYYEAALKAKEVEAQNKALETKIAKDTLEVRAAENENRLKISNLQHEAAMANAEASKKQAEAKIYGTTAADIKKKQMYENVTSARDWMTQLDQGDVTAFNRWAEGVGTDNFVKKLQDIGRTQPEALQDITRNLQRNLANGNIYTEEGERKAKAIMDSIKGSEILYMDPDVEAKDNEIISNATETADMGKLKELAIKYGGVKKVTDPTQQNVYWVVGDENDPKNQMKLIRASGLEEKEKKEFMAAMRRFNQRVEAQRNILKKREAAKAQQLRQRLLQKYNNPNTSEKEKEEIRRLLAGEGRGTKQQPTYPGQVILPQQDTRKINRMENLPTQASDSRALDAIRARIGAIPRG